MRITRVTLHPVSTRRETGIKNQHVIVRLETDRGITGIGEMSDMSHPPAMQPDLGDLELVANQLLVGREPIAMAENYQRLTEALPSEGKVSVIRCGLELALWDAVAKDFGQPVYNLIGGKLRDRMRVCYPIFRMTSVDEVESNLARVAQRYGEGFDLFRLYCGGNLDADELFLRGVRDRWGSAIQIKSLDLSALYDWKTGLKAIERLIDIANPIIVESPCYRTDLAGMAEIRRRVRVPISEHVFGLRDAYRLAEARAVDIFNVSLQACGGITESRQVYALAEAAGLGTLVGTTQELSIGTAAQLHLAAAMTNLTHPGDCTGPVLYRDDVAADRVVYDHSHAVIPDGIGWGITLDDTMLDTLRAPLTMAKQWMSPLRTAERTVETEESATPTAS
jgi:L-alanine-DL-glutamate epimerase-like enolase superfamily enzyme